MGGGVHTPGQTHPSRHTHLPQADTLWLDTSAGHTPPGQIPPLGRHPKTATATDGTHPTGMHSCYKNKFYVNPYVCITVTIQLEVRYEITTSSSGHLLPCDLLGRIRGVLVSVNLDCFSPDRFSHFHCNATRKAIKVHKNLHTNQQNEYTPGNNELPSPRSATVVS